MSEDRITKILEELKGVQQRLVGVVLEELQRMINQSLSGMLDPSMLMGFIKAMGFDPSKLPGMMSQQPVFDPYQVLGLDKSATDDEVKKRYRILVHKLHPDTAGTEGTSFLFQMVLAAYEIIKRQRGWQ